MKIIDVTDHGEIVQQIAQLLVDGFSGTGSESWDTVEEATDEVRQSLASDRISRAVVDESVGVIGWISGIKEYDGKVWELHPLVVHKDHRRKGVGRALVEDFEQQVKLRGCSTIRVGTDDENNRTSIGGIDLYPDVLKNVAAIKNLAEHPYEFYEKMGYVITGVIPDANGWGKPDILLAKRLK